MLTVGAYLKKARLRKNLTLEDVENNLRIRKNILEDVEANDFSSFTSRTYIAGVIRSYASFLSLPQDHALAYFRRDYNKVQEVKFKERVSGHMLFSPTKYAVYIGIACIFFVFFAYFGYQIKLYISPPVLTIVAPDKTTFRNVERIEIKGKTEKEATVTIFGERVYLDKEGNFNYDFPLRPGENKLSIEVTGGNGKKTTVNKVFILE